MIGTTREVLVVNSRGENIQEKQKRLSVKIGILSGKGIVGTFPNLSTGFYTIQVQDHP